MCDVAGFEVWVVSMNSFRLIMYNIVGVHVIHVQQQTSVGTMSQHRSGYHALHHVTDIIVLMP